MKRILEYRRLLEVDPNTDLTTIKAKYKTLMKTWHPDKFREDDEKHELAQQKSKEIVEAYKFLESINPETHEANKELHYSTFEACSIADFSHKGQTLSVTFEDGSVFEYFGVSHSIYGKLVNAPAQSRFVRRHIINKFLYRNVMRKSAENQTF